MVYPTPSLISPSGRGRNLYTMLHQKLTPQQTYIVSLAPDDEILASLNQFVKDQQIKSGYIIGIGAVKSARLGHYSVKSKRYTERKIKKPMELVNLTGIITTGKVHLHATLGTQMFQTFSGHLAGAVISAACEIIIVETKEEVKRKKDETVGLELLNLKNNQVTRC